MPRSDSVMARAMGEVVRGAANLTTCRVKAVNCVHIVERTSTHLALDDADALEREIFGQDRAVALREDEVWQAKRAELGLERLHGVETRDCIGMEIRKLGSQPSSSTL